MEYTQGPFETMPAPPVLCSCNSDEDKGLPSEGNIQEEVEGIDLSTSALCGPPSPTACPWQVAAAASKASKRVLRISEGQVVVPKLVSSTCAAACSAGSWPCWLCPQARRLLRECTGWKAQGLFSQKQVSALLALLSGSCLRSCAELLPEKRDCWEPPSSWSEPTWKCSGFSADGGVSEKLSKAGSLLNCSDGEDLIKHVTAGNDRSKDGDASTLLGDMTAS